MDCGVEVLESSSGVLGFHLWRCRILVFTAVLWCLPWKSVNGVVKEVDTRNGIYSGQVANNGRRGEVEVFLGVEKWGNGFAFREIGN